MHDFDFDVMEKKRIARGAFNKKGGSKSKRCTLPSDYLTPAQKKAMNGPMTTICLNQPMDVYSFLELSDSLKVEYIKYLQEHYHANWVMISRMLGCSASFTCNEAKRLGTKALPRLYDKEQARKVEEAWEKFCNGEVKQEEAPVEELPVLELEQKESVVEDDVSELADAVLTAIHPPVPESHPSRLDMTFTGWPDELTMTILRNMFHDQNVKVRISAEVIA